MAHLLNESAQMTCPHGGQVQATTSNAKVKADGGFVLRSTDTFTIAGCSLNIASAPHPCTQVQWVKSALKSKADGDFCLAEDSVGLCVAGDMAPQGTVQVSSTQSKVGGQ